MKKRTVKMDRINQDVLRTLSDILRNEVKDPRIALVTSVTGVEVARDLKTAKVYISSFGDEKAVADTMEGLKSSSGFIRSRLAKRLNMRNTPELHFQSDSSIAYGMNMSKKIEEVVSQDEKVMAERRKNKMSLSFDDIVGNASTIAIGGHVRPDGDCVGSCLAVYNYIDANYTNVNAQVYLEQVPDSFQFLKGSGDVRSASEQDPEYDLFICLDCGDIKRLGGAGKIFERSHRTFCVDHHMGNHDFADDDYVFPEASSTCELLCELMDFEKINTSIAECLYTGIVDDTGVFQYDSTSSKTMNIAGKLMDKGIDFSTLIEKTFFEKTYAQKRILAEALLSARLHENGRVISTVLSKKTMDEYHVGPLDTEGIVEQLRTTKGADVAIFLHENEDGTYKGSLRTSIDINLVPIALLFGGGGHAKAAGFTATGDPDKETIPMILDALKQEWK